MLRDVQSTGDLEEDSTLEINSPSMFLSIESQQSSYIDTADETTFRTNAFEVFDEGIRREFAFLEKWGSEMAAQNMDDEDVQMELEGALCDRLIRLKAERRGLLLPTISTEGIDFESDNEWYDSDDGILSDAGDPEQEQEKFRLFRMWYFGNSKIREGFLIREIKAASKDDSVVHEAFQDATMVEVSGVKSASSNKAEEENEFKKWIAEQPAEEYVEHHVQESDFASFSGNSGQDFAALVVERMSEAIAESLQRRLSVINHLNLLHIFRRNIEGKFV